ncbi:hypothetical protein [Helicobacter suis]|uniref:hypothetical protein n=1 Tax=Helicobacter suis TaxID=104628 RepID=UPI0013D0E344|nr:hypothetical protein [Helicobacter suis]
MDLLIYHLKQEDFKKFQDAVAPFGVVISVLPKVKNAPRASVLQRLSKEPVKVRLPLTRGALSTHLGDTYPYKQAHSCNSYHNPLNTHRQSHNRQIKGDDSSRVTNKPWRHYNTGSDSGFDMDI